MEGQVANLSSHVEEQVAGLMKELQALTQAVQQDAARQQQDAARHRHADNPGSFSGARGQKDRRRVVPYGRAGCSFGNMTR